VIVESTTAQKLPADHETRRRELIRLLDNTVRQQLRSLVFRAPQASSVRWIDSLQWVEGISATRSVHLIVRDVRWFDLSLFWCGVCLVTHAPVARVQYDVGPRRTLRGFALQMTNPAKKSVVRLYTDSRHVSFGRTGRTRDVGFSSRPSSLEYISWFRVSDGQCGQRFHLWIDVLLWSDYCGYWSVSYPVPSF